MPMEPPSRTWSVASPSALGRSVSLRVVAPLTFDLAVPLIQGRLVRALPGYFGLLRYLVELERPLPHGFDPLGELPWFARSRRVRTLVISPAPDAPTLETAPDVIGECVLSGRVLHVFVSVGPAARALRLAGDAAASESRCPFLCMADLEPLASLSNSPAVDGSECWGVAGPIPDPST
jgi:hypothetical protein